MFRIVSKSPVSRHALLLTLALGACGEEGSETQLPAPGNRAEPDWLLDFSTGSGVNFTHSSALDGEFFMPQIMGSGGALFDYDRDGDLDIYLVTTGDNRLFRQEADGTFSDVSTASGAADPGYGMGTAVGDTDNDGDLDLLVTNYGPNRYYRNNGDGTFSDVSEASGMMPDAWSTSAVFFDYDNDGWLDLYVANYLAYEPSKKCFDQSGRAEYCGPLAFPGAPDFLYRNNGDGSFQEVGAAAGVHNTAGRGLGVVAADFNSDGWQDVLVANDGVSNQLWINQGDGTFEDRGMAMGVAVSGTGKPEASMGIAMGDADGDLGLDLYMTHLDRETNTLYTSTQGTSYMDTTAQAKLGPGSLPWTGFGTGFLDLEHDGDLDLLVVNGRVRRPSGHVGTNEPVLAAYAEPNSISINDGSGRFSDGCALASAFCGPREVSRSLMLGDLDADGDLDVVITNSNGPARIYRNEAAAGAWLAIRALLGPNGRDAVGARVYVQVAGQWRVRPVTHAYSYLAGTDAITHFGLGSATTVDQIIVRWPRGDHERFPGGPVNETRVILRGQGTESRPPEHDL